MEEKQLVENIAAFLEQNPFKTDQEKKEKWYVDMMPQLHQHHLSKCSAYRNIWTHFNHPTKGREMDIQDAGQFRPLPGFGFNILMVSAASLIRLIGTFSSAAILSR